MTKWERLARWEKTRQMGMVKYISLYGILFWAIPVWGMLQIYHHFSDNSAGYDWYISLPTWLVGGAFFGWVMWFWAERFYAKHRSTEDDHG